MKSILKGIGVSYLCISILIVIVIIFIYSKTEQIGDIDIYGNIGVVETTNYIAWISSAFIIFNGFFVFALTYGISEILENFEELKQDLTILKKIKQSYDSEKKEILDTKTDNNNIKIVAEPSNIPDDWKRYKICPKCGIAIRAYYVWCSNCGNNIKDTEVIERI